MKKLIFLSILTTITTKILFAGPMAVVEVGTNVQMNIATKIEATKTAIENAKQTVNQVQQLKNDAMNLQNWANSALLETVGLTTQDINNILEIKRMSGEIYEDANSFISDWNRDFKIDFNNMSLQDLSRVEDNLIKKLDKAQDISINFKKNQKKMYDTLQTKMRKFNNLNRQTQGNLDSQQLSNEINSNIYQSLESLQLLLKEQKAEEELGKRQTEQLRIVKLRKERLEAEKEYKDVVTRNKKFKEELNRYNNNLAATPYPSLND